MKKLFVSYSFFLLFITASLHAQYATDVVVLDVGNTALTKRMEQEASKLLTAFNNAYFKNTAPSIDFVKDKQSVLSIWEISPFKCIETDIIERAYATNYGYQIRNISVFLISVQEEDAEREISINFDKDGNISDIHFAFNVDLGPGRDLTDLRRRLYLTNFIENYQKAYYRKDISFISNVLIDDVIVTEREIITNKSPEKICSLPDNTREYIAVLERIFAMNERIDFKINETMLQQHPKHEHIYGVIFVQTLHLKSYSDMSYVFLYIDFNNENEPLIKVRIWSPYEYGKEKYNLDNFM